MCVHFSSSSVWPLDSVRQVESGALRFHDSPVLPPSHRIRCQEVHGGGCEHQNQTRLVQVPCWQGIELSYSLQNAFCLEDSSSVPNGAGSWLSDTGFLKSLYNFFKCGIVGNYGQQVRAADRQQTGTAEASYLSKSAQRQCRMSFDTLGRTS